jgi:hypothetical protein
MIDPVIELPGTGRIALSVIETDSGTRSRYLSNHRGNAGNVLCLCRYEGIPMGVAYREFPMSTYYLYPLHRTDPLRHAPVCPHHFVPSTKDMEGVVPTLPVVEVCDNKINININVSLYRGQARGELTEAEKEQEARESKKAKRVVPASGKPASLLEYLWAQAQINVWRPFFAGKRNYAVIHRRLQEAVVNVQIRRNNLAPLFYCPPPYHPDREEEIRKGRDAFLSQLAVRTNGRKWYGYIVGQLKSVDLTDRDDYVVRLTQFPMKLHINSKDWKRLREVWFAGKDSPEDPEHPVFLLVQVERYEGAKWPWLYVHDIACLFLSDNESFLPVLSGHERRLAQRLVAEQRAFRKPLAVESEEPGLPLPGFILEDREDRIHMEIVDETSAPDIGFWRKQQEVAYKTLGQDVWWWEVSREPDIPPLPERSGFRTSAASLPTRTP